MNIDRIGIIGLGYVGLPLAIEFSKFKSVIGYDIDPVRVESLNNDFDVTQAVNSEILSKCSFEVTSNVGELQGCDVLIVTVPTPVDVKHRPDLLPLKMACKKIAKIMKDQCLVIFESTVFPGATEEICVPILEKQSGKILNKDFYVGYSPERINPGDKNNTLTKIKKLTSGSNEITATNVDNLYKQIIKAGTFKCESIKVAEASKIIENTQRDVNIALMNEFSSLFNELGIDTNSVIQAAKTKWNFIEFKPGLVGGHCIGVDPYYLIDKATRLGLSPSLMIEARKINESVADRISSFILRKLAKRKADLKESRVLILGYTFKENCPDTRNTKVALLAKNLLDLDVSTDIFDPLVDEYSSENFQKKYDVMILAVPHDVILSNFIFNGRYKTLLKPNSIICDLKGVMDRNEVDFRL